MCLDRSEGLLDDYNTEDTGDSFYNYTEIECKFYNSVILMVWVNHIILKGSEHNIFHGEHFDVYNGKY